MLISFCKTKTIQVTNMEKKYELIPSDREGLFRIKALKDFNDVKKGDIGGYVESERNLSQYDDCWIYGNAVVCDYAVVMDNARIWDAAVISDEAQIWDNAEVYDKVQIWGNAIVRDNAKVLVNARVCDNAVIQDSAVVRGECWIHGNAIIRDIVYVGGNAEICGDALISSDKDYIVFKNWWSSGRYFTWTRSNNMWKVGCFYGTGDELIIKAYTDDEKKGREYERIVKYAEIVNNF